jgi:hypothetical protein
MTNAAMNELIVANAEALRAWLPEYHTTGFAGMSMGG